MKLPISNRLIISLYDDTEVWPGHYIKAGYPVICWDKKKEGCILEGFTQLCMFIDEAIDAGYIPYGGLFAPPCTDFAGSGARWWKEKDRQKPPPGDHWTNIDYSIALVEIIFHLLDLYPTFKFWSLENPVGRIEKKVPALKPFRKLLFNPCDYGDPYTKKTILWGNFNAALPRNPVTPKFVTYKKKDGTILRFAPQFGRTGGTSEKTKSIRSATPAGFAKAFFTANQ